MLKTILFTHDDLDGAGCRIVFNLAFSHLNDHEYKILNCSNNNIDDQVIEFLSSNDFNEDTAICFGDICPSREVLESVSKTVKNVYIWDHHRTNFFAEWIVPSAQIIPENDFGQMECGTSIMFKYFNSIAYSTNSPCGRLFLNNGNQSLLSSLVETIRSYDTYEWKETGNIDAKRLQTLFRLLGMERFCHRYIARILFDKNDNLIINGDMEFVDAKMEAEQRAIDNLTLDDIYDINIKGYRTAFALNTIYADISEAAHQFLTRYPEFDMFAGFSLSRGGMFSFRSLRDDIDLGKDIALPLGGGGHPKAAGARLPREISEQIADMIIEFMNS